MRIFLVLALACGMAPALARAAAPPLAGLTDDAHELIVLGKDRPYRLRFHMRVRGGSFQAGWGSMVGHLFRHLDVNGDGVLSWEEVERAPSVRQWQQILEGSPALEPDAGPTLTALRAQSRPVSLPLLAAYYSRAGGGPLQVQGGALLQGTGPLTDALFGHLDRDRDGKLSARELDAAWSVLSRLDSDGDEMILPRELGRGLFTEGAPALADGPAHGLLPVGLPLYSFQPGAPAGDLASKLLDRYDRDRDGKLSRAEFRLPAHLFARLDRDGDGKLDPAELARYPELPADLELALDLAPREQSPGIYPGADPSVKVRIAHNGVVVVDLPEYRLEVVGSRGARFSPPTFREAALARFRTLDRNGDGVLDKGEIFSPPFDLVALLRLADRDGDGKISREEYESFLRLRERVHSASTHWQVLDRGRSLFGLLDEDQDGRLGQRELRTAQTRLAPWGKNLSRETLPRLFRLTMSHGEPLSGGPQVRRTSRGPVWFRKMDRNGDGDVSRAEWLGTEEQFREIDSDGDGLISSEEAEKADGRLRRPR